MPKTLALSTLRKFKIPICLPIKIHDIQNIHNIAKIILSYKRKLGDLYETPNNSDTIISRENYSHDTLLDFYY